MQISEPLMQQLSSFEIKVKAVITEVESGTKALMSHIDIDESNI
jgi:hypothetical protein